MREQFKPIPKESSPGSGLPRAVVAALLFCACSPDGRKLAHLSDPVLAANAISGAALSAKHVVLTFDDGPDAHTLEIAEYLASAGIHTTFFINGRRLCKVADAGTCLEPMDKRPCDDGIEQAPVTTPQYYPESMLDQVTALGHRIANHSEDHCVLTDERLNDFVWELDATQAIVDRHVSDGLWMLRPPYGDWSATTAELASTDLLLNKVVGPVVWDIDGNDWRCWRDGTSVEACGQRYLDVLAQRPSRSPLDRCGCFTNCHLPVGW